MATTTTDEGDEATYKGKLLVHNFTAEFPVEDVLKLSEMQKKVSAKWGQRKIKLYGSSFKKELAKTVKVPGVHKVLFVVTIDRATFKFTAAEGEDNVEEEIPFLPLTMEYISKDIPSTEETVKRIAKYVHTSFTDTTWIIREGEGVGHVLPATATLPGLTRVNVATIISTSDKIDLPQNLISQVDEYKLKYKGTKEAWAKGLKWTGYASEKLIEAVLFDGFHYKRFTVIFGKARYLTLFKSRGSSQALSDRWDQMRIKLTFDEGVDTSEKSDEKRVHVYYKDLFNVLYEFSLEFDKLILSKKCKRELGHWAYLLKHDPSFQKLFTSSGLDKDFKKMLEDLIEKAVIPPAYIVEASEGEGSSLGQNQRLITYETISESS